MATEIDTTPQLCLEPNAYRYTLLPDGCIRLLRLMPHRDESAPIQCQLFDYTLLDSGKGTHLYEALSYVWGSEEKPHSPTHHSLNRIIWIDAICINQSDTEERNRQVQFMAEIFAKATRVVVWLEEATTGGDRTHGETTTDSNQALEEIRVAADRQTTKALNSMTNQQAVLTLLQRSWFQRIWVLQEVAAARQVLIMCHSTEIDGSTFCSGLNMLNTLSLDPDNQGRFHSIAYLINGANLRPKYATSRAGRFSLDIRPLGELMDMYHNRKATDPRDKIYALLGMSSDDHIPTGLFPDYDISWKELFHRLVKSLLSEQASVETWEEKEIAVIQTKGWILGCVCKVAAHRVWIGSQVVEVILKNVPGHFDKWVDTRWILQASAKSIQDGDVICLLQGAARPTIIRLYEDYCAIIAISVTPIGDEQTEEAAIGSSDLTRLRTTSLCDFLIVWDWENPCGKPEDGEDYGCFINSRELKHTTEDLEDYSLKEIWRSMKRQKRSFERQ
ncbi:heterokaryon incompatibility protein-domain-containing protein [Corynascus similis CBS 632.67]